jgi:heptosyltransferase-2
VVLAPGAAYGTAKQWPPARFAELAARVVQDGHAAVLVGSGGDRSVCADVAAIARRRLPASAADQVVDLSGRTSLAELAALMARAAAVVSNDSGAMHLAGAVGAPVVAVFGATDEQRTAPLRRGPHAPAPRVIAAEAWCRPCLLRECPIDHRCMTRLTADAVYAALPWRTA